MAIDAGGMTELTGTERNDAMYHGRLLRNVPAVPMGVGADVHSLGARELATSRWLV